MAQAKVKKANKHGKLIQTEPIVRKTRFSIGASIAIDRAHRGLRVISQKEIDELEARAKHRFDARLALGITMFDDGNPQKMAQLTAYLEKHPFRARRGGAR